MNRNKYVIALCAAVILAAAVFIHISNRDTESVVGNKPAADNTLEESKQDTGNTFNSAASGLTDTNATSSDNASQSDAENTGANTAAPEQLLHKEVIKVDENSAEFDLKAMLCENNKTTFLRLEYYMNGESTLNEFSEDDIPELKGIFEKRESNVAKENSFRIKQILLNAKYSNVYFTIIGEASADYCNTAIYCINLKDLLIKKLAGTNGKVGSLLLCGNSKYLAYSYLNPASDSVHRETGMLDVINCENNDFAIKYSRDANGKFIGTNRSPKLIYNFELVAWKTNTVIQLKQVTVQDGSNSSVSDTKPIEVLYDMTKNVLLNLDGTVIQQVEAGSTPKASITPAAESECLNTLKNFYSYLASEKDYPRAMEFLDEGFYLEMDILKQFGVDKIVKEDIDVESASLYSEILKAARFDMLVKEKSTVDSALIYYYQTLSLNEDSQIKQALEMQLKKMKSGWKILSVKDADQTKAPFIE